MCGIGRLIWFCLARRDAARTGQADRRMAVHKRTAFVQMPLFLPAIIPLRGHGDKLRIEGRGWPSRRLRRNHDISSQRDCSFAWYLLIYRNKKCGDRHDKICNLRWRDADGFGNQVPSLWLLSVTCDFIVPHGYAVGEFFVQIALDGTQNGV